MKVNLVVGDGWWIFWNTAYKRSLLQQQCTKTDYQKKLSDTAFPMFLNHDIRVWYCFEKPQHPVAEISKTESWMYSVSLYNLLFIDSPDLCPPRCNIYNVDFSSSNHVLSKYPKSYLVGPKSYRARTKNKAHKKENQVFEM